MTHQTLKYIELAWDQLSDTDHRTLKDIAGRCQNKLMKSLKADHAGMLMWIEGADAAARDANVSASQGDKQ